MCSTSSSSLSSAARAASHAKLCKDEAGAMGAKTEALSRRVSCSSSVPKSRPNQPSRVNNNTGRPARRSSMYTKSPTESAPNSNSHGGNGLGSRSQEDVHSVQDGVYALNSGSATKEINTAARRLSKNAAHHDDRNRDGDSSARMMTAFEIVPKEVEKKELDNDVSGHSRVDGKDDARPSKTAWAANLRAVEPAAVTVATFGWAAEVEGAGEIEAAAKPQPKTVSRSSPVASGRPSQLLGLNNSSTIYSKSPTEDAQKCNNHGANNNHGSYPRESADGVEDGLTALNSGSATKDVNTAVRCLLETAVNHDDIKRDSGSRARVASAVAIIPKEVEKNEPDSGLGDHEHDGHKDDAEAGTTASVANLRVVEPSSPTVANVGWAAEVEVARWIEEALSAVVATCSSLSQDRRGGSPESSSTQRSTTIALAIDAEPTSSPPATSSMVGPAAVTVANLANVEPTIEKELARSVDLAPPAVTLTVESSSGRPSSPEKNTQSSTAAQSATPTVTTAAGRAPMDFTRLPTDVDKTYDDTPGHVVAIIPCVTGGDTDPKPVGTITIEVQTNEVGTGDQQFAENLLESGDEKPWTLGNRSKGEVTVPNHEGDGFTADLRPNGAANTATCEEASLGQQRLGVDHQALEHSFAEVQLELNEVSRYSDGARYCVDDRENGLNNTRHCSREVKEALGWKDDFPIAEIDYKPPDEGRYSRPLAADQR